MLRKCITILFNFQYEIGKQYFKTDAKCDKRIKLPKVTCGSNLNHVFLIKQYIF